MAMLNAFGQDNSEDLASAVNEASDDDLLPPILYIIDEGNGG